MASSDTALQSHCKTSGSPVHRAALKTDASRGIVEDMQQMKIKHTKIIKELGNIRKENQEQTITTMKKHYGDKMRSVKAQLEAYQELMNKRSTHWQVTIKNLRERNRQLSQDKEELLHQINHQTEKWKEEKTWILENVSKNLDRLYAQHILTLQELQNLSLYVEKVHDLVNFRIKNLQKKSEKTAIEKADVSVVLELKAEQEQTITTMKKHYGDKMRSVKAQLEAYQELMNKRSTHWQVTIKNLRERNRQLSQDKEELLHQINHQTEKWKEEKTWILENVSKNLDRLYAQHILTLQELQNLSLYVEKVHDLVNFRIKNLQKKSEKTAIEKADVSVVLELKAEQVADKEMKPEWLVEKGYLWEARVMLQKIQESLDKREKEVAELLQSARRYSKALKPQITMQIFLKTLVQRVHNIYCDVPEAQQYLHQLIRKNKDERADRKEAFNNAQADILSYKVFYGNEPMDDKRTQVLTKLFRNLGRAKSELEYVETEEIVFDCIQTGEIPNWIKKDCLYVALTADPGKDIYSAKTSHLPDEVMKKFKSQIKAANETKEQ
nr:PREDICTED: centrosome-associated protein CEP250-like [Struthio camelus australis]